MLAWMPKVTNNTKDSLKTDWWISMDADEVLDVSDHVTILTHVRSSNPPPAWFLRRTFFVDHRTELKEGVICSHVCHRLAPIRFNMSGDLVAVQGVVSLPVTIYHYGHIRKPKAWIDKSIEVFSNLGDVPEAWKLAKEHDDASHAVNSIGKEWLRPFTGTHPVVIRKWLKERGMET